MGLTFYLCHQVHHSSVTHCKCLSQAGINLFFSAFVRSRLLALDIWGTVGCHWDTHTLMVPLSSSSTLMSDYFFNHLFIFLKIFAQFQVYGALEKKCAQDQACTCGCFFVCVLCRLFGYALCQYDSCAVFYTSCLQRWCCLPSCYSQWCWALSLEATGQHPESRIQHWQPGLLDSTSQPEHKSLVCHFVHCVPTF